MNQLLRILRILRSPRGLLGLAGAGGLVLLLGQTAGGYRLPVWDGAKYVYPYLGGHLLITGNVIDAVPSVVFCRQYAARPAAAADGSYSFMVLTSQGQPFQSSDAGGFFQVYRNGLCQSAAIDYQITMVGTSANSADVRIVPMGAGWSAGDVIRVSWVM